MPVVEHSAFVVKFEGRYCRFGSYRNLALVDNPLGATLYMRKLDANKRVSKDHYLHHRFVPASEMTVEKISVKLVT